MSRGRQLKFWGKNDIHQLQCTAATSPIPWPLVHDRFAGRPIEGAGPNLSLLLSWLHPQSHLRGSLLHDPFIQLWKRLALGYHAHSCLEAGLGYLHPLLEREASGSQPTTRRYPRGAGGGQRRVTHLLQFSLVRLQSGAQLLLPFQQLLLQLLGAVFGNTHPFLRCLCLLLGTRSLLLSLLPSLSPDLMHDP